MEKQKPKNSVLVICAHSDDQIFGPGATLAKYAKEKHNIYTVILSYGENSLPWLKKEVAIKTRVKEAEQADKIIGGRGVVFCNLKENKFLKQANTAENIIKNIIKARKPSKIFTHNPDDPHPDHRATYKIITNILEKIKYHGDVYAFDVWSPFSIRKTNLPKLYVDVTETFPLKVKALKIFESQKASLLVLFWSVYVRAFVHGSTIHTKYAERFFKLK